MTAWELKIVLDVTEDEPQLLGSYTETVEDTIGWKSTAGVVHQAPADCVRVVTLRGHGLSPGSIWAVLHG